MLLSSLESFLCFLGRETEYIDKIVESGTWLVYVRRCWFHGLKADLLDVARYSTAHGLELYFCFVFGCVLLFCVDSLDTNLERPANRPMV